MWAGIMGIEGKCDRCGGTTYDYECLRCIRRERDLYQEALSRVASISEPHWQTVLCDSCSYCVATKALKAGKEIADA